MNVDIYVKGVYITGAIAFVLVWLYALMTWGLLLGLMFGWVPAIFGAVLFGFLWPLVALVLVVGVLAIIGYSILAVQEMWPWLW